ncbi:MarR family transcriptional regulator [Streptomyces sp. JJ38]|nr:MarR family transcriptional regulator [Streptomyces sp. JJ38]
MHTRAWAGPPKAVTLRSTPAGRTTASPAFQSVLTEFTAHLEAAGHHGLRPLHGMLFQALRAGPATSTEPAEHLGITKQAAGQIVDGLEGRGYVERLPHPAGGRRPSTGYHRSGPTGEALTPQPAGSVRLAPKPQPLRSPPRAGDPPPPALSRSAHQERDHGRQHRRPGRAATRPGTRPTCIFSTNILDIECSLTGSCGQNRSQTPTSS